MGMTLGDGDSELRTTLWVRTVFHVYPPLAGVRWAGLVLRKTKSC